MKTKSPLLPIVLAAALVAGALILPAVAFGKQPGEPAANKPVNWVIWGGNSNNLYRETAGWQGMSSRLVKQLGDGSVVGHAMIQTMKDATSDDPRFRAFTTEFLDVDPATGGQATWFYEGDFFEPFSGETLSGEVAIFVAVFQTDEGVLRCRFVLIDGGEPFKDADIGLLYIWGEDVGQPAMWLPFFDPAAIELGPGSGNIQVHLGD